MISFSSIDGQLSVLKNNSIVLFGAGAQGKRIYNTLEKLGIGIHAFCDNDENKRSGGYLGVRVISPDELCSIDNRIVIITTDREVEIEKQLRKQGELNYILLSEFDQRIYDYSKHYSLNTTEKKKEYIYNTGLFKSLKTKNEWPLWDNINMAALMGEKEFVVFCLPPKTGDWTLNSTMEAYGRRYVNLWHSFSRMTKVAKEVLGSIRLKIVTAVRDPIEQNISIFFNMSDTFWDEPGYWEDGGDVQLLFDAWINQENGPDGQNDMISSESDINKVKFEYFNAFKNEEGVEYTIQSFFEKQFEPYCGIDVYNYQFDKDKGYGIIHDEYADVFIYQLEKIEEIKTELSEYLGIPDMEYVVDNVGEKKWYAKAYRESMDSLLLTEKYIDDIYSSRFVRHFYNENQIAGFKMKWLKHVREVSNDE